MTMTHKPGDTINYKGQRYLCEGYAPHINARGELSELAAWSSHCADCGVRISVLTPVHTNRFEPGRRCSLHKSPGRKVRQLAEPAL